MLLEPTVTFPVPVIDWASVPIVERMSEVMRRHRMRDQPTTLDDFFEAEETCDLGEATLRENIGRAARKVNIEFLRRIDRHPALPIAPWDFDADYRHERIAQAANLLIERGVTGRNGADLLSVLVEKGRFSEREVAALRLEILTLATTLLLTRKFALA